jgi:hypothetical protein
MILWTAVEVPEPVEGPTRCPAVSKSRVKDILKLYLMLDKKEKGERF